MMSPQRTDMEYGYRLRNFFTGEVIADRKFATKSEMEEALQNDLSADQLFGKLLDDMQPEPVK